MKLKSLVIAGAVLAVVGVAGDRYDWSQKLEIKASAVAAELVERYQTRFGEGGI